MVKNSFILTLIYYNLNNNKEGDFSTKNRLLRKKM